MHKNIFCSDTHESSLSTISEHTIRMKEIYLFRADIFDFTHETDIWQKRKI
jgi:hypothetical protein